MATGERRYFCPAPVNRVHITPNDLEDYCYRVLPCEVHVVQSARHSYMKYGKMLTELMPGEEEPGNGDLY